MRTRAREVFATARSEGALLPSEVLERVAAADKALGGLGPLDYHLAPRERLGEAISRSWNRLTGVWESFAAARAEAPPGDPQTTLTRERWLLPLFQELGYGRLVVQPAVEIEGRDYPVSHGWQHSPIHLVGAGVDLDRRSAGVAGAARQSPHALVQELLNRSEERLWGIVSNGLRLRLLRDNVALTRQAFVEFDLEAMMEGEAYADFALLWLVCHQSRVEAECPQQCWLEQWSKAAADQGTRALDRLRAGVEESIQALGRGFLAHPANGDLREALRSGDLASQDYYRELLRVVYRLLFLFVAEDRDLLADPRSDPAAYERYRRFYSTERLRRLAGLRRGSKHPDLARALALVVRLLGSDDGASALGLPALGGFLFSKEATPSLAEAELDNYSLLAAVRALAFAEEAGTRRAVDFRNLGSEELGSVYESLLELHPVLNTDAGTFALESASGHERKTTGSYYTPTSLITSLLDSALEPLLDERARADDPEEALLSLTVCDPACGSGHFLIAAAHRIAKRLAAARTGEAEPGPEAQRTALREVIGRCLYGVDLNPMAVELCKVSLWMEALEPGRPLSFLDAHIRPGNALLGSLPGLVEAGIPDTAFKSVRGDDLGQLESEDKEYVTKLRKRNADERRRGPGAATLFDPDVATAELTGRIRSMSVLADDDRAGLRLKEQTYSQFRNSQSFGRLRVTADAWAAAALAEKRPGGPGITQATVYRALEGALSKEAAREIEAVRSQYSVFHWHLEFPEVFAREGFDLVLGNPPWDALSPDLKEFFAPFDPQVRFRDRAGQREIVGSLLEDDRVAEGWRRYCRELYASVHAFKDGGRYRLFAPGNLGKGDFNVYRMFVETALAVVRPGGFAAQIVPENLATGANAAAIRSELLHHLEVRRCFTFENTRKVWFPAIHPETKFVLYVACKQGSTEAFDAAFLIRTPERLVSAEAAPLRIPTRVVERFSPDALAIMRFDSQREIDAVEKAYVSCSRFGDPSAGEPHRTYMREIDMGNDRELFSEDPAGLPLYEGRMVWQYDHRAKGYRSGRGRAAVWEPLDFADGSKSIQSQWRVLPADVPRKAIERIRHYRVGFCDVTSPTTERSLVVALIPPGVICGHKVPTFSYPEGFEWAYAVWLAVANSFAADFIVRKKVALTMALGILDSLPFPRPGLGDSLSRRLVPRVARLTCTSPEMTGFWNLLAADGFVDLVAPEAVPGETDDERRIQLRSEIEAIVAADVYGLERDELEFVLSTFPLAARYETHRWGEFRSGRLAIEAFDALARDARATGPAPDRTLDRKAAA